MAELRVLCTDLKKEVEVPFQLTEVKFSGNRYYSLENTSESQWIAEAGEQASLCYYLGNGQTEISICPKIKVKNSVADINNIKIKAVLTSSSSKRLGINETGDLINETLIVNGKIDENIITCKDEELINFTLGQYVDYFENLNIKWYILYNNTEPYKFVGESSNEVFVTYFKPVGEFLNKNDRRVLFYSCNKALGMIATEKIIIALWEDFEIDINEKDDIGGLFLDSFDKKLEHTRLTYYKTDTDYHKYSDLLNGLDSQCGAFRDLWELILNGQGIETECVTIGSDEESHESFLVHSWGENDLGITGINNNTYDYPFVIIPAEYESSYFLLLGNYEQYLENRYITTFDYENQLKELIHLTGVKYSSRLEIVNKVKFELQRLNISDVIFKPYDENSVYEEDKLENIFVSKIIYEEKSFDPILRTENAYPNNYNFLKSELNNLEGWSGQGNRNPFKDFDRHFCLKVGDKIYDPSYGRITEGDEEDHKAKCIQYYFIVKAISIDEKEIGNIDDNEELEIIDRKVILLRPNN